MYIYYFLIYVVYTYYFLIFFVYIAKEEVAYSLWAKAGATLKVKLILDKPLIAEWLPPPIPSIKFEDLVTV